MEVTKIKLLRVLEILQDTDEDHPITTNQILEQLKLYGISAERKAVQRDIAALQDYGYDIILHEDNKKGWYMASRLFEDWELKVLLDAAMRRLYLTYPKSQTLSELLTWNQNSGDLCKAEYNVITLCGSIHRAQLGKLVV